MLSLGSRGEGGRRGSAEGAPRERGLDGQMARANKRSAGSPPSEQTDRHGYAVR